MTTIDHITLEVADPASAAGFYTSLGLDDRVRLRSGGVPGDGFSGFTLSLVASQPGTVDALVAAAVEAGATVLKPASKSLWGYGGVVTAPDGTIVTVASSSKKDTGPATLKVDDVVLQLGVDDVAASKRFYAERGFTVAKSFGRKYAELDTGAVTLTLNRRKDLAKVAGVDPAGAGAHGVVIGGADGAFTDPDGFRWES
ncbi:glyoxalase [Jiangella anatolica]|uniref:Glyoxalase n=1 Tax=Jiangella anatolica TaxID=2670374 RepID=A0A2W2C228_9ACTN|nr:glyoxalase [Jiangella anatolica]PZF82249.1 glyoxalase [Jiangella anatolica]